MSGENKIHTMDMEVKVTAHYECHEKARTGIMTLLAIRAIELHNLLSCYHRTDGESVHMSVGDIS